jgi:hypothetical protein
MQGGYYNQGMGMGPGMGYGGNGMGMDPRGQMQMQQQQQGMMNPMMGGGGMGMQGGMNPMMGGGMGQLWRNLVSQVGRVGWRVIIDNVTRDTIISCRHRDISLIQPGALGIWYVLHDNQ